MAAPTPQPIVAASEIGVSRTRSVPKVSARPRVTPNGIPCTMSWPSSVTVSSSDMAAASARRMASPYVTVSTSVAGGAARVIPRPR